MRIAIYAGTFDPITNGHLSILRRVAGLFDQLIVLVAVNPDKTPLFSEAERVELIRDAVAGIDHVSIDSTKQWVADYAQAAGAGWLIRGVRDTTDMSSEHQLASLNQQVAPEVTTLFVPAESALSGVSSSKLKQLAASGQPIEPYCTLRVAGALRRRLRRSCQATPEASHAT
jgi:pantetheine-phosphate adenylyltransferase